MDNLSKMKSNDFAIKVNAQIFGIEFNRFTKIVTALRGHSVDGKPLFPDARQNSSEVTGYQCAHLLRALALNLNPFSNDIHGSIARAHTLRDSKGEYYVDTLESFLSNGGIKIKEHGLQRISFSQDRDSIAFIYREPLFHEALSYSDVSHYVVKEHDQIFGEGGPMKFERYSIIKQSALMQVAEMLLHSQVTQ